MSTTIIRDYHFTYGELNCRCGCGMECDIRLVEKLEALRLIIEEPIIIHSGARCPNHNKAVGGADDSWHMKGLAIDTYVRNSRHRRKLVENAIAVGFTGIGIAKIFTHLDLRPAEEALIFLY